MMLNEKGVTLLEIMLVLAIAAMIIVMSVRYYQSATTSSQANAFLSQMQAIVSAADTLAVGANVYSDINLASLQSILGEKGLTTPWGDKIGFANDTKAGKDSVEFFIRIPERICRLVLPQLAKTGRWAAVMLDRLVSAKRDCSHYKDGANILLSISPHENKYDDTSTCTQSGTTATCV